MQISPALQLVGGGQRGIQGGDPTSSYYIASTDDLFLKIRF